MAEGPGPAEVFGVRAGEWAAWQASPWGRLRYSLVRATTARALAGLPGRLHVIDVGGGDGADSLPWARAGHDVTVLDFSAELLGQARRAGEQAGVADRLTTVHADLDDLTARPGRADELADASFDVVLCHNVLQYRADVPATVSLLARLVRPGGVVSTMAPNPAMDVLAAAVRRLDLAGAVDVLDASMVQGETFNHPMRRLHAEQVEAVLKEAGCTVEHRFGIRCVTDLIADDERKADPAFYQRLEELELLLCDREPYRRTARFWQLVARRADRAVCRHDARDERTRPRPTCGSTGTGASCASEEPTP